MVNKKNTCHGPTMRFLKMIREKRGLTQYGMAKYLDMIINTYIHYETKAQGIKLEVLANIRKKLDLTWEEMGGLIDKEVEQNRNLKDK